MARTFLSKTKEAVGIMPAMGVKCVVEEIEKGETGENAATPGALMYTAMLRIVEPARFKGAMLRDWFTIGTRDDKKAKRDETWQRSEGGAGRLARLFKRAGVAISDDDEEWMEAIEGAEVCATVTKQRDRSTGEWRNRIGLYFREEDDDFIGIGEELEAEDESPRRGGRPVRGSQGNGKTGPVSARGRMKAKAEDEDEETDEEEEKPASKKVKTKKPEPEEDEDEETEESEEDEDEEPPATRKKAAAKIKAKAKRRATEEDEEDEDED
jgi:hypothetical protein